MLGRVEFTADSARLSDLSDIDAMGATRPTNSEGKLESLKGGVTSGSVPRPRTSLSASNAQSSPAKRITLRVTRSTPNTLSTR